MGLADQLDLYSLATSLIAATETAERARLLTSTLRDLLPESACVLYRVRETAHGIAAAVAASAGEVTATSALPLPRPILAPLAASLQPLVLNAADLRREDFSHLHLTRSFQSLAYLPVVQDGELLGVFELIAFEDEVELSLLASLEPFLRLAGAAIRSGERLHQEQGEAFQSIHRLTQLYDLEKQLNATLDLDSVMELVPQKVIGMLPSQAIHLWLFDGADLRLMARAGEDLTVELKATEAAGEGYVADMAEEGEPTLITDAGDDRLTLRNREIGEEHPLAIRTAALVPLMQDNAEIGVVEAVNRADGQPFDDDDLFFLMTMSETISSALKNASLMFAERKLQILETLVQVSAEITSTLRLERLLQIIVNSPQAVLSFERCSVALDQRGRLQLKAVSGMDTLRTGDVTAERLRGLLHWLSGIDGQLLVRRHGDAPEHADEDVREHVGAYFAETDVRALFTLPLVDDQGRLGLLLYESSDPDFLEPAHIEMIKVLGGQATVAMRNALLYREVPLIALMEPLLAGKRSFLRSDSKRRWLWSAVAATVLLFLLFCPLPQRLSGSALVAPQRIVSVAAPVDGTVDRVYAREGQHVKAGMLLGELADADWKRDYASAQTRYQTQLLAMQSDLAAQSALAGRDRTLVEQLRAEMERAQQRLVSAQLRSPIEGTVVTPHLQNSVGKFLDAGSDFAQVLDNSGVFVNVALDEEDAALVRPGQAVAIKLTSFPTQTFHGRVAIVSPGAELVEGKRAIMARVLLPNGGEMLRDGMDGRAKVSTGLHPAGYVLLRRPALWVWQTLWNWIGW